MSSAPETRSMNSTQPEASDGICGIPASTTIAGANSANRRRTPVSRRTSSHPPFGLEHDTPNHGSDQPSDDEVRDERGDGNNRQADDDLSPVGEVEFLR